MTGNIVQNVSFIKHDCAAHLLDLMFRKFVCCTVKNYDYSLNKLMSLNYLKIAKGNLNNRQVLSIASLDVTLKYIICIMENSKLTTIVHVIEDWLKMFQVT